MDINISNWTISYLPADAAKEYISKQNCITYLETMKFISSDLFIVWFILILICAAATLCYIDTDKGFTGGRGQKIMYRQLFITLTCTFSIVGLIHFFLLWIGVV